MNNGAQKIGCINCKTTKLEIGHHEFQDLLGQKFHAYFCYPCYARFRAVMSETSPSQQVEYLTNLGRVIAGKATFAPLEE